MFNQSHHITPLVINALRGRHTHTHIYTYQHANQSNFKKPGAHDLWPHTSSLKMITFSAIYVNHCAAHSVAVDTTMQLISHLYHAYAFGMYFGFTTNS